MNLILHDVAAFKGFAIPKIRGSEFSFLQNVSQNSEILGSAANVVALHAPRISLEDFSVSSALSPIRVDRKGDLDASHDYQEWIEQSEAVSRFEWEGGRGGCPSPHLMDP